jgi:hypothetical protein
MIFPKHGLLLLEVYKRFLQLAKLLLDLFKRSCPSNGKRNNKKDEEK